MRMRRKTGRKPDSKRAVGFRIFLQEIPILDRLAALRGFSDRAKYLQSLYEKDRNLATMESFDKLIVTEHPAHEQTSLPAVPDKRP